MVSEGSRTKAEEEVFKRKGGERGKGLKSAVRGSRALFGSNVDEA